MSIMKAEKMMVLTLSIAVLKMSYCWSLSPCWKKTNKVSNPLLSKVHVASLSIATAAQLTLNVPSSHAYDEYLYLRQPPSPTKAKAMKELRDLKTLQDARLGACEERGKDWEHCFMFGDSSTVIKKGININSKTGSVGEDKPSGSIRSQRPPTW